MKHIHTPRVDARYWAAITLASVFGTNLGDFYAHASGLGIVKGLAVLAILAAIVFVAENVEKRKLEAYYWLVIVLIRTGATNIADYLAFRARVPELTLTLSLAALLALFGWRTRRAIRERSDWSAAVPETDWAYWMAMLTAGVFGTVVGDICSHAVGEGAASIGLGALLLAALFMGRGRTARIIALYWTTVAIARTAGTAMGDWLAENQMLNVGLTASTLITGAAFAGVLMLWRSRAKEPVAFEKRIATV